MSIHENGITILRVMQDLGAVGGEDVTISELLSTTGLSEDDLDHADTYLLQGGFVEGVSGGATGKRWLNPYGIQLLEDAMSQRLPLNLNAERILSFIVESPSRQVQGSHIISTLDIDTDRYLVACQQLDDLDLIVDVMRTKALDVYGVIAPTKEGRQAILYNFKDQRTTQAQIQTGPIFNAPVTAQNFQAFTNAIDSQIEQSINITENDPTILLQQFSEILGGLVNQISSSLPLEQQASYAQAAVELKKEIEKDDPEIEAIQKWLARLSLLDSALTVGNKTITLATQALPAILMISKLIQMLLES